LNRRKPRGLITSRFLEPGYRPSSLFAFSLGEDLDSTEEELTMGRNRRQNPHQREAKLML
jgi:hypothetical protein